MRTTVRVLRGPLRGREGWIAGDLEHRATRGITKALVHCGADVELLETKNLAAVDQLELGLGSTAHEKAADAGRRRLIV